MNAYSLAGRALVSCILAILSLLSVCRLVVAQDPPTAVCQRTITANVVALDQPILFNRLGASSPDGLIFALERDVVPTDYNPSQGTPPDPLRLEPGKANLRADKRPRPLILRANVGDCVQIRFRNLLSPSSAIVRNSEVGSNFFLPGKTRYAGVHIMGLELVKSPANTQGIDSDGAWVGRNANSQNYDDKWQPIGPGTTGSLARPGERKIYTYYARAEGTFLLDGGADPTAIQVAKGLFGAIHVQPAGAEWYRSQVTRTDLHNASCRVDTQTAALLDCPLISLSATSDTALYEGKEYPLWQAVSLTRERRTVQASETIVTTDGHLYGKTGHPILNYHAVYPSGSRYPSGQPLPADTPILHMLQVHKGPQLGTSSDIGRLSAYAREISTIESGVIPAKLRQAFADRGVTLSQRATLAYNGGYQVIVDNEGSTYLAEAIAQGESSQFSIWQASLELVHSDLTAIITGPNAGRFPYSQDSPTFRTNPALPDRRQPYREFSILYHQPLGSVVQAFPDYNTLNLYGALAAVADGFGINYGVAGIGSEILANRLGVGPMGNKDAVDLKFEEFFLSSWSVGDPAMVVDVPANANFQAVTPRPPPQQGLQAKASGTLIPGKMAQYDASKAKGLIASKVFYPEDPSNVYHSYMNDALRFRILHAGSGPSHVHHLHAHQWLHSPNSDNSEYLDSQMILPGSTYTLEIAYGSGNRNKTVGDAIFHCHFYPHFAQGMWALWRVHDVFEAGTALDPQTGVPLQGAEVWNRALPDGEIAAGTPIPALVPMPTLGMAPIPAPVRLTGVPGCADMPADGVKIPDCTHSQGRRVEVQRKQGETREIAARPGCSEAVTVPVYDNPGYPFFIPGVSGHRPPHPPLDFAWKEDEVGRPVLDQCGDKQYLDGGLPRHIILGGSVIREAHTRWDFSKDFAVYDTHDVKQHTAPERFVAGSITALQLPELGTEVEKAAMQAHATRTHATIQPNGDPGNFTLNGLPPAPGAPYAAPDVSDAGNATLNIRRYKAAVIQTDVVINKKGWHYPQQRMLSLWEDVVPVLTDERPPQPFFFRSNTGDSIEFWHTDLVPYYYELDDFQVRTPTDVIGQHIHLVKFDVTSSDGAGNGFNYEDGTFSPDEVRDRIHAANGVKNSGGGLYAFDPTTQFLNPLRQTLLNVKPCADWYGFCPKDSPLAQGPPFQNWDGAQTTIQRWDADPLLNNDGDDRTLRTVFTHDHFGPSTHQQAGLYAGLLIEPEDSKWFLPDGTPMYTRDDGGPTNWEGYIVTRNPRDSYREFALEFQDLHLAYTNKSPQQPSNARYDPAAPKEYEQSTSVAGQALLFQGQELIKQSTTQTDPDKKNQMLFDGQELIKQGNALQNEQNTSVWFALPTAQALLFHGQELIKQSTTQTDPDKKKQLLFDGQELIKQGDALSKGELGTSALPACQPNCVLPFIREQFSLNGRVLSAAAAILATPPDSKSAWEITNPLPNCPVEKAACKERFPIRLNSQTKTYMVYDASLPPNWASPSTAISPPTPSGPSGPGTVPVCDTIPTTTASCAPFPQVVSSTAGNWGTFSVNYRNEPVSLRVARGNAEQTDLASVFRSIPRQDADLNCQPLPGNPITTTCTAAPPSGFIFPKQPLVPTGADGVLPWDPYTPLLRAYTNDRVQVRTLVGAHEQSHTLTLHGLDWLSEPSERNSGYRSAQGMGISEHFEMLFTLPPAAVKHTKQDFPFLQEDLPTPFADYFYAPSADVFGLLNGNWGILRAYSLLIGQSGTPEYLAPLPNNAKVSPDLLKQGQALLFQGQELIKQASTQTDQTKKNQLLFDGQQRINQGNALIESASPGRIDFAALYNKAAKKRSFQVVATTAQQALGGPLDYNPRVSKQGQALLFQGQERIKQSVTQTDQTKKAQLLFEGQQLIIQGNALPDLVRDPQALLYVRKEDLADPKTITGKLRTDVPIEPLILRAAAGEWLRIDLYNALPKDLGAVNNDLDTCCVSSPFGHASLPSIPLQTSSQAGLHPQLLAYDVTQANGINVGLNPVQTVAPQGGPKTYYMYAGHLSQKAGCTPTPQNDCIEAQPMEFGATGLVAADLLIQHQKGLYGALIIEPADSTWIEDTSMRAAATVTTAAGTVFRDFVVVLQNDVENSKGLKGGAGAVNYRFETTTIRMPESNELLDKPPFSPEGFAPLLANSLKGVGGDPATPIFQAAAGLPSRFAFVFPGGTTINVAQRPFVVTLDGHVWQEEPYREQSSVIGYNPLSQWLGGQTISPYENINMVLGQAGGTFQIPGDYLYTTYQQANDYLGWGTGTWGIFRVNDATISVDVAQWSAKTKKVVIKGKTSPGAKTVQVAFKTRDGKLSQLKPVTVTNGAWEAGVDRAAVVAGTLLTAVSSEGAVATKAIQGLP